MITKQYRKSQAVKDLESLATAEAQRKYPDMPPQYLCPRIYRDKTANELTKCIVDYITIKGGFASRINSMGVYRQKLNKFTPGTQRKGIADIMATYQGKSLHIEVKAGTDRMRPEQMKVRDEVKSSGGYYYVAKDFESFKIWFDQL